MYHICQTDRSKARQHLIADTFLAMLQTQRFHEVQITTLCREAGIPRKAFYRYFDSKEDIIPFLVEDLLQTILATPTPPITDRASAIQRCARFFRFWMERPALLNTLARPDTLGLLYGSFMKYIVDHETFMMDDPEAMEHHRISTILATSSLFHLLLHWSICGEPETAEELGQIYYNYLTKPLYPAPEG